VAALPDYEKNRDLTCYGERRELVSPFSKELTEKLRMFSHQERTLIQEEVAREERWLKSGQA
jgi:hypothetical protein